MTLNRNTVLDVQKLLNKCDLVYLGVLLARTKKEDPFYDQILFALSNEFDSTRRTLKQTHDEFINGLETVEKDIALTEQE